MKSPDKPLTVKLLRNLHAALLGAALALAPQAHAAVATEYGAVAATSGEAGRPAPHSAAAPKKGGAPATAADPAMPVCSADQLTHLAIDVTAGQSRLLKLPAPIVRRTLGDKHVVEARLLGPQTLYLLGVQIGATNMILQENTGKCSVLDVAVSMDTSALQAKLAELLPTEKSIRVSAAADSLVLSGTVSDAMKIDSAVALANAYVRRPAGTGQAGGMGATLMGGGSAQAAGVQSPRIVNLLAVGAPQQVMLEVKIAEISKSLLDKLGASINKQNTAGGLTFTLLANFLTNGGGMLDIFRKSTGEYLTFDAEKKDGLVKILAEPNVMAISGQEGSFLAGGKIFIPVAQTNNSGVLTVTLEEKEFGVGLKFTPTVLEGGRINLRVAPEVSELSREGVGISLVGEAGRAILPLMTTRRAATTVQLMDGQSFAIGGLIKNNVTQNIKAFPVLGEIPVLGALFRSTDFQSDKSELVFVVTPRLVKPLPPDYKLPTDGFIEPTRSELFLGGKMEGGAPTAEAKPAAKTDTGTPRGPTGFEQK